jgi:hypothetical protein
MVVRTRRTGERNAWGVGGVTGSPQDVTGDVRSDAGNMGERIVANPRHVKDAGNVRNVGCVKDTGERIVAKPRHVRDAGNVGDVGSVRDTESRNARGVRRGSPQGGQTRKGKSQ